MTHTRFTRIGRDAHSGTITRDGNGEQMLGKRGIKGAPGSIMEYRVVSVEDGAVKGWGNATAIGRVEMLVDGVADEPPFLSLLA